MDRHSDSTYKRYMIDPATHASDSSSPSADSDSQSAAPDPSPSPATDSQLPERILSLGPQIAGGLLCINAALVLLSAFVIPVDPALGPMFAPERGIVPAIIDALIGVSLLSKKTKYIVWAIVVLAIVRTVLGTVVYTALSITKEPMIAASQVMVGLSLLLLLIGQAGRLRIGVASALFFVYSLLNISGLSVTLLGVNPLGPVIQHVLRDIESAPDVLVGQRTHYHIKKPSHHWYLRKDKEAKKTNPLADLWLTRPDLDAHVLIIVEKVPGQRLLPDALVEAMVENTRGASSALTELSREPMPRHPKKGRVVHLRATVNGQKLEYLSGTLAAYEYGYQIITFASQKSFPKVEAELRSIFDSFELPTDEALGVPDDAEPGVVSKVVGLNQPYELTAPDGNYFLRKQEAAHKDNPLADRWLVRPDLDAHILVIAERLEGADLNPDHYVRAVADAARANFGATDVSTEVLDSHPKEGRLLHAKATVNGLAMEYYFGCFARGEQAFQVLTFVRQDEFPALAPSFRKAIDSFVLPPPLKIKK